MATRLHITLFVPRLVLAFIACQVGVALLVPSGAVASGPLNSPIPPFVAGFDRFALHDDIGQELAGQLLLTELSCTACHAENDAQLSPKRGPKLEGAGSRLRTDWIRSFLLSPATAKAGSTMPDMLSSVPWEQREAAANALAAFLGSQQQAFPEIKATGANPVPMEFWNRGSVDNGRVLYHAIGCVACHEPDNEHPVTAVQASPLDQLLEQLDPEELQELGLSSAARRVHSNAFPMLPAKYTAQSLTFFLLNPEHRRPAGRMPNFSLLATEAADLTAWLIREIEPPAPTELKARPADESLVAEGRKLFGELRCASCHSLGDFEAPQPAQPLAVLTLDSSRSCLMPAPEKSVPPENLVNTAPSESRRQKGQPAWILSEPQHAAIDVAIRSRSQRAAGGEQSDANDSALTLRLLQQNCYACHERAMMGGVGRFRKPYFQTVGNIDIGDEGRLPPSLTGVGKRLTKPWMTSVLSGKGQVRPHMTIRMPVYPADIARPLPEMLTRADGGSTKPLLETEVFAQADTNTNTNTLLEAGRQLMDTGCVQCHAFNGETLPGTVGIDLEGVTQRVHPAWLHDFLKDPGSLKERTRMPNFFPDGKSQNSNILDGDVELQIAAIHAYLKNLSKQPLPEKIRLARAQDFELSPTDRPIVLRTFMQVAGTHAIAVGFPEKIHYSFDAEQASLAQAWRGRFLDAEGTWFIRSAPPSDPLGDSLINFPQGCSLAILEDESSPWPTDAATVAPRFTGYRLDRGGVPTFLYKLAGYEVSDRVEPSEDNGLRRMIKIRDAAITDRSKSLVSRKPRLWFRVHAGRELRQLSRDTIINKTGLAVTVKQNPSAHEVETLLVEGASQWLVPVDFGPTTVAGQVKHEATIEVHYRW